MEIYCGNYLRFFNFAYVFQGSVNFKNISSFSYLASYSETLLFSKKAGGTYNMLGKVKRSFVEHFDFDLRGSLN